MTDDASARPLSPDASAPIAPKGTAPPRWRSALLVVAGLALTAWLITSAGAGHVLSALEQAGPWLPVVLALEIGVVLTDVAGARLLLAGAARLVTPSRWIRSTLLAYASSIFLPTGRAAAEAVRATILATDVGLPRASRACARLQACALLGNATISLVCALSAVSLGAPRSLPAALAVNGSVCLALGVGLLTLERSGRFSAWLRARFSPFRDLGDEASPGGFHRPLGASLASFVGRGIQAVQYGAVLYAVGIAVTPRSALTAQGIHLVGAAVGDLVPNQLGATEGAYTVFGGALGTVAIAARALSVALVVRVTQVGLALSSLVAATLLARPAPARKKP